MRRLILAAILSVLALPAAAERIVGCRADHGPVIAAAWREAEARVDAAIRFLNANPDHPHVREWFGTTPAPAIRGVLKISLYRLQHGRRPEVECLSEKACVGGFFATARFQPERIGLCPRFFGPEGQVDRRFGILLHEVTHLAAGTQDRAYGPRASRELARRNPSAAATNADNFEYFVELLPDAAAPPPATSKQPR
ncbi:MAG: M35 family metallopeptidase [Acetobacteraceae bacterium]|nr:M35 family metallopeptidase [Acetobacteraceae bacterium]